jgi:hypothetical protein|nr:MAG TPA: hypothetical protein [Caudoviricetes sp.]
MERLTLENAIKYIKEVERKNRINKERNTIIIPNSFIGSKDCADKYGQVAKWLEKLKDYNDLEEQGLLLKLPIPLNTTVYTIYTKQWCYYDDNCMEDIEYKCMNGEFCENQKVRHYLHIEKFSVPMINFINKTVFLTREEAENRLKELENE